jgi:putative transcriptional regulator
LNVSQAIFAKILNVSVQAVRAWEQGDKTPKGTTTRLLQIIEKDPTYFIKSISEVTLKVS